MHVAVDVAYRDGGAVAAAVTFADWASGTIADTVVRHIAEVKPYRPGRFFERELPCILEVLSALRLQPATVVVDGYVTLGSDGRAGLGAHLHAALDGTVPVIGVAKTRFEGTPAKTGVMRGGSLRPLYVTSIGIDAGIARERVRMMHGSHRMPTVLAAVDRACRES